MPKSIAPQVDDSSLQDWAPIYFKKRSLINRQDFQDDKIRTLSYLRNFLIWIKKQLKIIISSLKMADFGAILSILWDKLSCDLSSYHVHTLILSVCLEICSFSQNIPFLSNFILSCFMEFPSLVNFDNFEISRKITKKFKLNFDEINWAIPFRLPSVHGWKQRIFLNCWFASHFHPFYRPIIHNSLSHVFVIYCKQ